MKFKFQAQDSFLEYIYIFFEIWRSKNTLHFLKKTPLIHTFYYNTTIPVEPKF